MEAEVTLNNRVILSIVDLVVDFGQTKAVDGVSLEVNQGEIFGLLGPNGAGKTTLLSAIEGLVKPASGRVVVAGLDGAKDRTKINAILGVALQSTSFQAELSISQLVRLYGGLYNIEMNSGAIRSSLESAGLSEESNKRFKQLSGGQQQRLSLLIANIADPLLLLLDEPTAGLDPQSRRKLWGVIEQNRRDGGSILLTTHSMEEAQSVCDRVAIIDHGKIITVDSPKNLIEKHSSDPRVLKVARGQVTLEDVFIGLTGGEIRD
ncbi:MAG: ABC transporter ATP-binding protein [Actinomycetota bacterium]|nr:ABC transporter ATP-binding protein [Actinomycetota bacterium]